MDNARTIMPNGRYTDAELNLLKNVFAEDLPLIKILRKVMLQLNMTEAEEVRWRQVFKGDINNVMRKMFLPEIDGDAPISQVIDLWMTVNLENKLPEEEKSLIGSRKIVIDYIDAQLKVLSGEEQENTIKLCETDYSDPTSLKARNTIIAHVENQLREINGLAGYKSETPEETLKRLQQNSTK